VVEDRVQQRGEDPRRNRGDDQADGQAEAEGLSVVEPVCDELR
jgi:hypothetical protein